MVLPPLRGSAWSVFGIPANQAAAPGSHAADSRFHGYRAYWGFMASTRVRGTVTGYRHAGRE